MQRRNVLWGKNHKHLAHQTSDFFHPLQTRTALEQDEIKTKYQGEMEDRGLGGEDEGGEDEGAARENGSKVHATLLLVLPRYL
jgi:hypothetical protein